MFRCGYHGENTHRSHSTCHTWFSKKNRISHVRQDQVYSHMIDIMSEKTININKNIQELNHYIIFLLHSDVRLEGLKNEQMITRRSNSVFSFHRHMTGSTQGSELIVVAEVLFSSVLFWIAGMQGWAHLWLELSKWGKCKVIKNRLNVLQRLAF
jgi:hypothetical protein